MEVESKGGVPFPAIQNYSDYRKFLEDFYTYKKSFRSGFSFRMFSQLAGIKSPNYLQLVMRGERNLSEEMAASVAKAMRLKEAEKKYFVALVRAANSSGDENLRARMDGLSALKKIVTHQVDKSKAVVFSKWHHLLIRELVFLADFEPNGEYVSEKMRGLVTVQEAQESLELLINAGFLSFKDKKWQATDPVIDSGDALFAQASMVKVHSEMMKTWSQHLPNCHPDSLEMGLINIPMAKKNIPELKKRIREFQDQIIGWLQAESEPDSLVQLGTYVIPIVEGESE